MRRGQWVHFAALWAAGALFLAPIAATLMGSLLSNAALLSGHVISNALGKFPFILDTSGYDQLLLSQSAYLRTFWMSIWVAAATALGQCVVSLVVAFPMLLYRNRISRWVLGVYAFVMLMPFQVTLLPNFILSQRLGLYNTLWALILPGVFAPMGIFLCAQYGRQMPLEIIESARMDTDSPLLMLVYVAAPNLWLVLAALALLSFAEAWNMVEQPLVLLRDLWKYPLSLALHRNTSNNPQLAFTGAVLYMLPLYFLHGICQERMLQSLRHIHLRKDLSQ